MKAFFFDLDNTLVKFKKGLTFFVPHFKETLLAHSIEADEATATEILASGMINGRLQDLGLVIHDFWATFNRVDYGARRRGLETGEITLFEDALPILERLMHEYLAIVSNTHLDCVMLEMDYLGLTPYFKKIVAYTGTENPKPHPQMARMAQDGKVFDDVYVVGDAKADILCGKAIGAKTIHVDRFGDKIEADFKVKNLGEMLTVVF